MLHIEWRDEYRIDGGTIDDEHRTLLDMANRAFDLLDPHTELTKLIDLVQALVRYIDTHFSHEEALMMEANYPDLVTHMQRHRKISQQLTAAVRGQKDIEKFAQYLQHIMLDWVVQHILTEDLKFGRFLEGQNAVPAVAGATG